MKLANLFIPTGTLPMSRKREQTAGAVAEVKPQGQGTGSYGEHKVLVRHPDAALTISAVYRAVELRAKTEGQFLMQYQRLNREGGNFVQATYGEASRLNYLLQVRPNPMMSATAFFQGLAISRLQFGNGIAYIERSAYGNVEALWLCTGASYNDATGKYILQYFTPTGLVERFDVSASDVIHLPNTFKLSNGWGIPTLTYAADTLSLIKTEGRQALEVAAKGGRMKLIIGEEKPSNAIGTMGYGMLNKDAINNYALELSDKIYQQDVIGIRGLDKVMNISLSAAEQQMVELLGLSIDDVARFWGTPRPLLMADTNSHYTTYQNATMEYLTRTVQPDMTETEQEFNAKLLTPYDFGKYRFHLCEQPLLRLDKEAQAKVDQLQLQTGAATVNEIRAQYDRPAVEGGDTIYLSTNLAELGSEKLRGASPAPAQPAAQEGEEGKQ